MKSIKYFLTSICLFLFSLHFTSLLSDCVVVANLSNKSMYSIDEKFKFLVCEKIGLYGGIAFLVLGWIVWLIFDVILKHKALILKNKK